MPSLFDRLFAPRTSVFRARDAGTLHRLMQSCVDDPDAALAALQEEQALLARELEETFLAHDAKTRSLAARLATLEEGGVTHEEIARLRAEQLDLWRLVRRAQASGRATHELEREFHEWRTRTSDGHAPSGHPDHPDTRLEIVASELAVRGRPVRVRTDPDPFDLRSFASVDGASLPDEGPAWEPSSVQTIRREIAHREREIARLHTLADHHPDAKREVELLADEMRRLEEHLA